MGINYSWYIVRIPTDAILETFQKRHSDKEEIEQAIGIIVNEQLPQLVALSENNAAVIGQEETQIVENRATIVF